MTKTVYVARILSSESCEECPIREYCNTCPLAWGCARIAGSWYDHLPQNTKHEEAEKWLANELH